MASQAVDIEGGWGRLGARQQAADRIARMPGGRVEAALLRLDLAWDRLDLLDRWTEPDTRPDLPGEGLRAELIAARDEAASALGDAGQPEEAARRWSPPPIRGPARSTRCAPSACSRP
jgi:hypothetical protein